MICLCVLGVWLDLTPLLLHTIFGGTHDLGIQQHRCIVDFFFTVRKRISVGFCLVVFVFVFVQICGRVGVCFLAFMLLWVCTRYQVCRYCAYTYRFMHVYISCAIGCFFFLDEPMVSPRHVRRHLRRPLVPG